MGSRTLTVGVIASAEELRIAARMREPPDVFELRLDCLPFLRESQLAKLRRPLLFTARRSDEGGKDVEVSRRDLLLRFLGRANWVDIELRSLRELRDVWHEARRRNIGRICSRHDFRRTPDLGALRTYLKQAQTAGADIFKIVTRADRVRDLLTLLRFLGSTTASCAMATGRFGAISRLLFPDCGSRLVYAPLRHALHDGQLTLHQLRRLRDFYAKM